MAPPGCMALRPRRSGVLAVTFGRMFGGKPVTHRRVEFASVAYARFFAAAYSAGPGIGAAARACMPGPPLAAGKTKSAWVTGTL